VETFTKWIWSITLNQLKHISDIRRKLIDITTQNLKASSINFNVISHNTENSKQ